ncbi:hypothetical protein [Vulcanisaeta sp. EB80]|uniref:hypothetical protein n=1 Tax=Vulcanisaeta sp. EB80 TaxID=1650660 RepID=UPI00117E09CA|nr:hypothetical protein [Vulcanisaeta sp. EB80]
MAFLDTFKPGAEWIPEGGVDVARSGVDFDAGGFCEGLAYDVLAYYKPYTRYKSRWGIYFILPAMLRDLERLSDAVQNNSGIKPEEGLLALIIHPGVVFLHELCHHTLENVRVSMGLRGVYEDVDEGLCQYTAFRLVEESSGLGLLVTPYMVHHGDHIHVHWPFDWPFRGVIRLRWNYPLYMRLNSIDRSLIRRALSILYKWWGLDRAGLYRPAISTKYTEDFLAKYLEQLRGDLVPFLDHALSKKPVNESDWARVNIDNREWKLTCRQG